MINFDKLDTHMDRLPPGDTGVALIRANARDLLVQIDSYEQLHTTHVVPLHSGMWSAVYKLEPQGVVAKLAPVSNAYEADFLREAYSLGVKVPKVISSGQLSLPDLPESSYLVLEYIPNSVDPWELLDNGGLTPDNKTKLAHDIGTSLSRLHRNRLGYVRMRNGKVASWQNCLTDFFTRDWDGMPGNILFKGELLTSFRHFVRKSGYLDFSDGVLIHGDLNLTNVLVNSENHELTAILDPGGYAGMAMYDLAYAGMPFDYGFDFHRDMLQAYISTGGQYDDLFFWISVLVICYRHKRFHTDAVSTTLQENIVPKVSQLVSR